MSSHGDDFTVTAVQLAALASAMGNGGKLLTPFFTRTPQEEKELTPRIRRLIAINSDSFRHMVPGMTGAVSYGSGRKAFDPREIVVGKTGTCIEHGNWVGLFTSYAPLKNPRLAIAVIARGSDGRNHFPAAVAGRIYRDVHGRFALPANAQIARTRSEIPIDKSISRTPLTEAERKADLADAEESSDSNEVTAPETTAVKPETPKTVWIESQTPPDNKVKKVIMSIPKRIEQIFKPSSETKATQGADPKSAHRPRRVVDAPQ
jgi:hypothetical protein